jgi:DNA-binding MarR family transcriptional regulator
LIASARQSIGVLPLIAVRIQRELMEATLARGHIGLKMSHGQVLPLIGPEGGRIHEIARIQQVSRQAVSATSQDLEALGYLRREPDPRDRRGVLLRLTRRGTRLIDDSVAALDGLERSFRDVLGSRRLAHLEQTASDLFYALQLEEEVFAADSNRLSGTSSERALSARRDGQDIRQLAARLRSQLGKRDTARLVALLEPRSTKTAT